MDRTEAGLQWMRRLTQWTLASVAGLVVLIPASDLLTRDDESAAAVAGALTALSFVGYVQTRLLLGGMAGLHEAPRSPLLVGAAALVGLGLWGALVDGEPAHWMWVLPFSGVVCVRDLRGGPGRALAASSAAGSPRRSASAGRRPARWTLGGAAHSCWRSSP